MASLNAALANAIGSTTAAAFMLFAIGLASTAAVAVLTSSVPTLSAIAAAPWYCLLGGVIVAFYILSVTYLAPRFGVGNTILFVMVAQILVSSAIDHFGMFGAPVRPLDVTRLLGLALLLAGLLVTQLGAAKS
jgi:transporter family-2 protein